MSAVLPSPLPSPYAPPSGAKGPPSTAQPPVSGKQGSLLRMLGNDTLVAQEKSEADARAALQERQNSEPIQGLAGYVRRCWIAAWTAKINHENDMLTSLRMRQGEYDPTVKAEIANFGGTDLYMRIGATKMRAAQSWLKDIFLNIERPFTVTPTPEPTLQNPTLPGYSRFCSKPSSRRRSRASLRRTRQPCSKCRTRQSRRRRAVPSRRRKAKPRRWRTRSDEILVEGSFYSALEDMQSATCTTFKGYVLKDTGDPEEAGPQVVHGRQRQDRTGRDNRTICSERVSLLMFYPAPQARSLSGGYMNERHRMQRGDLGALLGVEGYDEEAIREVLEVYGRGGLRNWLSVDSAEQQNLANPGAPQHDTPEPYIETMEFWGGSRGRCSSGGVTPEQIPDANIDLPGQRVADRHRT